MMRRKILSKVGIFLAAILFYSCFYSCSCFVQKTLLMEESVHFQLVPEGEWPSFEDDLDRKSLERVVVESLSYLKTFPPDKKFFFGSGQISNEMLSSTLTLFLEMVQHNTPGTSLRDQLKTHFDLYRMVLNQKALPMLITGYYEPQLTGSRIPSSRFKYPIYRLPDDLLLIDPSKFSKNLSGQKWIGRVEGNRVIPYYTRKEIDQEGRLSCKNLEILWVDDPVKLFFLHIQGSGQVFLEDGSIIKLRYQGTNGHPYFAIGRELIRMGVIQPDALSLQSIYAYLQGHPPEQTALMNLNPSYIFFQETQGGPYGNLGIPLTAGRSIAADQRIFPAAGLAWLAGEMPSFDDQGHTLSLRPFGRWVCVQDSGGAIKGPSRVDLFWGNGPEAEFGAGHQRHSGTLFILLKK